MPSTPLSMDLLQRVRSRNDPDSAPAPGSANTSSEVPSTWLVLCLAVLLVAGCDDTIEPFSEKGAYSIYGVLFSSKDVQLVRVKPLTVPITKVDSHALDATVTLENLTAGTSTLLRDSIITFQDAEAAVVTHNFLTDVKITPETRYRITVEGEAGEFVEATTVTPTSTDARITPQQGSCSDRYTVTFEGVEDKRRVRASWEAKIDGMPSQFRRGEWAFFSLPSVFTTPEGEVAVTFQPEEEVVSLLSGGPTTIPSPPPLPDTLDEACWSPNPCAILGSSTLRVRYNYLGPEWYGSVPEDSLSYDPLKSHDVAGGLGFFGSARRDRITARVDTSPFVWDPEFFCNRPPP